MTNEKIDQKIAGQNIMRVDDCSGSHGIISWKCLINGCGYVWKTSPHGLISGKTGCPNCAGVVKLSNNIIDLRLEGRNIKLLDDYVNINIKHRWKCLIKECEYIWIASASSVVGKSNTGCPKCANSLKLSNEEIDRRLILKRKNIKRIDDYLGNKVNINFQCLIEGCKHIWSARPNNILNGNKGCPGCAKLIRLTNGIIDNRLEGRPIKRLGDCAGCNGKIDWECLTDGCRYVWKTSPSSVVNNKSGCPKCAGLAKITNEVMDDRILHLNLNVKRIGNMISRNNKTDFMCLNDWCNYIWKATPNNILIEKGCPTCKNGKNERIAYMALKECNFVIERHKYIKEIISTENRKIFVDFYIKDFNTIIEYNGAQHYKHTKFGNMSEKDAEKSFKKQQERDKYLQKLCDDNNIKLIWINGIKYTNSKLKYYIINDLAPKLIL